MVRELTLNDVEALRELRRKIHTHPELGFEELRTSALIMEQLPAPP